MSDNPLYEYLGIDLDQASEVSKQLDQERLDTAKKMIVLVEMDQWKVFEQVLDQMAEVDKGCEVYAQKPMLAHYDSGYKQAFIQLKQFIEQQKVIMQKYETDQSTIKKDA